MWEVQSGMYRVATVEKEAIVPVAEHNDLEPKYKNLGDRLGKVFATKVIAQAKGPQSVIIDGDLPYEINFTVSLTYKDMPNVREPFIEWKDVHTVEICTPEKIYTKLFDAVVDVAGQQFVKIYKEFKEGNTESNFFGYGKITSSVDNQTPINKIVFRIWKKEKETPKTSNSADVYQTIGVVIIVSSLILAGCLMKMQKSSRL